MTYPSTGTDFTCCMFKGRKMCCIGILEGVTVGSCHKKWWAEVSICLLLPCFCELAIPFVSPFLLGIVQNYHQHCHHKASLHVNIEKINISIDTGKPQRDLMCEPQLRTRILACAEHTICDTACPHHRSEE